MRRVTARGWAAIFWFIAPLPIVASAIDQVHGHLYVSFQSLAGRRGGVIILSLITGGALLYGPGGAARCFIAITSLAIALLSIFGAAMLLLMPHVSGNPLGPFVLSICYAILGITTLVISFKSGHWPPSSRERDVAKNVRP
jgi:hypothetical protein